MRKHRKPYFFVLLALLVCLFPPQVLEQVREVFLNGSTFEFSCFDSPLSNPNPDGIWRASAQPTSGRAGYCTLGEGVLGETGYPAHMTGAQRASAAMFYPVLLPPASPGVASLPDEIRINSNQRRDPPPSRVSPAPPSLRAPPVA